MLRAILYKLIILIFLLYPSVSEANHFFFLSGGNETVFEGWDETTESVIAGVSTWVVVFSDPATSLGDDDFGQGFGLTQSDVKESGVTEQGNIDGSGVTGGLTTHRLLNQSGVSSQRFEFHWDLQNKLYGSKNWLVMFKISNYMTEGSGMLLDWNSGASAAGMGMRRSTAVSGATMEFWAPGTTSWGIANTLETTDQNVYVGIYQKDGQNSRAFAVKTDRPSTWGEIADEDKYEFSPSGTTFFLQASDLAIIGQRTGFEYITVKPHFMIISTDPDSFISD